MHLKRHCLGVVGFAVAALTLTGCGGDTHSKPDVTEAEVVVFLNNQPLPGAQVTLTPSDSKYGSGSIATGITDAQGRAKLTCGNMPGACLGTNRVGVTEASPTEARSDDPDLAQKKAAEARAGLKNRPIPEKYANVIQSGLMVEITKEKKEYKLELTR